METRLSVNPSLVPRSLQLIPSIPQNDACYEEDPTTSGALLTKNTTLDDLLSAFVEGVHHELRAAGKTPVVWEEVRFSLSLRRLGSN